MHRILFQRLENDCLTFTWVYLNDRHFRIKIFYATQFYHRNFKTFSGNIFGYSARPYDWIGNNTWNHGSIYQIINIEFKKISCTYHGPNIIYNNKLLTHYLTKKRN